MNFFLIYIEDVLDTSEVGVFKALMKQKAETAIGESSYLPRTIYSL